MLRQLEFRDRLAIMAIAPLLVVAIVAAGLLLFPQTPEGINYGLCALGGLVLAGAVSFAAARSIVRSVRQLVDASAGLADFHRRLADGEIPEIDLSPVPVQRDDELGRLAGAVNAISAASIQVNESHRSAIKAGLSTIVVNLARRSQTLLDRQVEYLDRLESSEEDPDRLGELFKVDHLATRMRRNAESLLVLAEADPSRRRGGPVEIADVLRVAMGEVEIYQDVELNDVDDGRLTATAAVDLAHLTAELMENATQFSPPGTPVRVTGKFGRSGGFVVTIADQGIGFTAEKLAATNDLLAKPPELGLGMGRSLGFAVIARLAQRLKATVTLEPNGQSGTRAVVTVPTDLFVSNAPVAPDLPTASAPAGLPRPEVESSASPPGGPRADILASMSAAVLGPESSIEQSVGSDIDVAATATNGRSVDAAPLSSPESVIGNEVAPDGPSPLQRLMGIYPSAPAPAPRPAPAPAPAEAESVERESVERESVERESVERESVERESVEADSVGRESVESEWEETESTRVESPETESTDTAAREATAPAALEATDTPAGPEQAIDTGAASLLGEPLPPAHGGNPWPPPQRSAPVKLDTSPFPGPETEFAAPAAAESSAEPEVAPTADDDTGPMSYESLSRYDTDFNGSTGDAWTPPPVISEPPARLEHALPSGEAFETGIASLLDDPVLPRIDDGPTTEGENDATASGLVRRKRGASQVPIGEGRPVVTGNRNPDEVRSRLSRYREGLKGRKPGPPRHRSDNGAQAEQTETKDR